MQCDLQLFLQRFHIGDSWFATRGSMPGFESVYFKSANNNSVTLLNTASPQSFPGACTPQRSQQHPGEQEHISQLAPTHCARSFSCYGDNWSQLGELIAQAVLPCWSHLGVTGLWPRGGSVWH